MAVLIEAISVVTRIDAINRLYSGGWEQFRDDVPNRTLCSDNEIARVGFMAPSDAQHFIQRLERHGLVHLRGADSDHLVLVDQHQGITSDCTWLEFGHIALRPEGQERVAACRLIGSDSMELMLPDGWQYSGSLSEVSGFRPLGQSVDQLEYLGSKDGMDVYLDKITGEKRFLGRS